MTSEQERAARDLLKEGLQWIGLTELNDDEEERATEVQERIERLLLDLGEIKADIRPDRPGDVYRIVLATREQMRRAEAERDDCRWRMNKAIGEGQDREQARFIIRRFQVAYSQWEEAERLYHRAEAHYYRALMRGD